jgi:ketosteroid isomerase-like protein
MKRLTALVAASLIATSAHAQQLTVLQEVDALFGSMVAAFKSDPASVAKFYSDDASILGGGQRSVGREEIDQYWKSGAAMFADWKLEVIEVGEGPSPWVRGRSTVVGKSGSSMTTEFVGLLKRQPDGRLKFYVDMYVAAGPMRRSS